MLGWLGWCAAAFAGGTWLAVADPAWNEPGVQQRFSRQLGPGVVVVPATDLVQQGRAIAEIPASAQPGRVLDPELHRIRRELEPVVDAGDCAAILALADQVSFVDRSTVRRVQFDVLVAAAECADAAGLKQPPWLENVGGEAVSAPLSRAAALARLDPSLPQHVASETRLEIERLQQVVAPTVVELGALAPDEVEVRVDGVVVPATEGRVELPGRRADLQLVRVGRGRAAQWGPSFRVQAGADAIRPMELAADTVGALVGALPSDGGAGHGAQVGAWVSLVDADALYLATIERRRWTLWRWDGEGGRFVPAR